MGYSKTKKIRPKKWTKEALAREFSKHNSKKEVQRFNMSAYNAALRQGLLDKLSANFTGGRPNHSLDNAIELASKVETVKQFREKYSGAYHHAHANGYWAVVKERLGFTSHNRHKNCVYVIANRNLRLAYVGITAQPFEKRVDQHFSRRDTNSRQITSLKGTFAYQLTAYEYSRDDVYQQVERDWFDFFEKLGFQMLNDRSRLGSGGAGAAIWTKRKIFIEAKRYTKASDFIQGAPGAYARAKALGVWGEVKDTFPRLREHFSFSECLDAAGRYTSRNDFKMGSKKHWEKCLREGWMDEIAERVGYEGDKDKWSSKEKIAKEAAKFRTRHEFHTSAAGAYAAARKMGCLDEICSHMPQPRRSTNWTEDEIWAEVKGSASFTEWKIDTHTGRPRPSFRAAYRRKMIEAIKTYFRRDG